MDCSVRSPSNTSCRSQSEAHKGCVLLGTRAIYIQPAAAIETPLGLRVRLTFRSEGRQFLIVVLGLGLCHVVICAHLASSVFFTGTLTDQLHPRNTQRGCLYSLIDAQKWARMVWRCQHEHERAPCPTPPLHDKAVASRFTRFRLSLTLTLLVGL